MIDPVDGPVQGFSIAFHMPSLFYAAFFGVALAIAAAAAWWLGTNLYLYWRGIRTEGTVVAGSVRTRSVESANTLDVSERQSTHHLTIEYAAEDRVTRKLKATAVTYGAGGSGVGIGAKVPVLYSRSDPTRAVYDAPRYALGAPALLLALALTLLLPALGLCWRDIRIQNSLDVSSQWTEDRTETLRSVIIDCDGAIRANPNDDTAFERRGDAQFALAQFGDAVEDYSKAMTLAPARSRAIRRKRAKAAWLDGRDFDALRGWLSTF